MMNLLSPLSLTETAFNWSRIWVSALTTFGANSTDAPDSKITSEYVLPVDSGGELARSPITYKKRNVY